MVKIGDTRHEVAEGMSRDEGRPGGERLDRLRDVRGQRVQREVGRRRAAAAHAARLGS